MPNYLTPENYNDENDEYSIKSAETNTTAFIGVTQTGDRYENRPTLVIDWNDFVIKFGRYTEDTPYMAPAVSSFFLNGGQKAYIVKVNDDTDVSVIGVDNGRDDRTGLQSLLDLDSISIILTPGITGHEVMKAMIRHCEYLEDRIVIFDTPKNMTSVSDLIDYSSYAVSTAGFAVLYTPWYKSKVEYVDIDNNIQHKKIFIPPCGALAGLYAKVDREKGVHHSVASNIIEGALALEVNYNSTEQSSLYSKRINFIRMFPKKGIVVWGARTTATNPEMKYISIRRFLIFVKVSILQSTQWVVLEENTQHLWTKLRELIEHFLFEQWRGGALAGARPDDAYFVQCGYKETMTADDITHGRVICMIGMSVIRPAEFQILKLEWEIDN